jgi:hypothetical protein
MCEDRSLLGSHMWDDRSLEDDPNCLLEFYAWFLCMYNENEYVPDWIIWFDEGTFKHNACLLSRDTIMYYIG